MHFPIIFLLFLLSIIRADRLLNHNTQVPTTSGLLHGFVSPSYLGVRQFLGIPYAQPPIDQLRFLSPRPNTSNSTLNATSIGPACPQQPNLTSTILSATVYGTGSTGGNQTEYYALQDFSEDCLTLNIWAPLTNEAEEAKPLPVLVWFFGGGFDNGGTNSPYYNPQSWVQRTQAHIVVTVNFRSNIFGFPNAAGLTEQNLGILDQRLSLEWVRDNIDRFGGDPAKIVSWGQSAGGIAVDYLDFAFYDDPIVSGRIMHSTTALFTGGKSTDYEHGNFSLVASSLGCSGSPEAELACMRTLPWKGIEDAIGKLEAGGTKISFVSIADEHIVFRNYTERYELGLLSHVPALTGSNLHELNVFFPHDPSGPSNAAANEKTIEDYLCPTSKTAQLRTQNGRITYLYRYDGNFSNIAPGVWSGAYHASELPLLFGTEGNFHGPSTAYERVVGEKLQDLWLGFAEDPERGLEMAGWGQYSEGKAVILGGDDAPMAETDSKMLDGVCPG